MLGIFSWFGYVMPISKRVNLIKSAGFDATTLWWEDEVGDIPVKKEEMPGIAREAGLYIENIHAPYMYANDLWSENRVTRQKCIDLHYSWLEACAVFEIPIMVMHVIAEAVPIFNTSGVDAISEIAEFAAELKVKIALENLKQPQILDLLFAEINSDALGLCYDSSHDWLYSEKKTEIIRRWGSRLLTTHISDNDGLKDRHWLPGKGIVNWPLIKERFVGASYSGCLTLEAFPVNYKEEAPEVFIKSAYKSLTGIL